MKFYIKIKKTQKEIYKLLKKNYGGQSDEPNKVIIVVQVVFWLTRQDQVKNVDQSRGLKCEDLVENI